jgi:hypothetical protein
LRSSGLRAKAGGLSQSIMGSGPVAASMLSMRSIETAPKDGTFILASKDSEIKIVVYYPALKEWGNPQVWGDNGTWNPTHWMHLPYLPTGEIYE